jgi:hypothetical protein
MPLNPFFLHGSPSEQRLVQDLVNEHLKMFGQDVLYLPRKIVNTNTVIKEITASRFDDSFRLEAYLTNYEGFGSPSEILSKFGVRSQDELTLVISKERYDDFITPFLKLFPEGEIKVTTRPQEGDLIYLPLDNALFEIKFVETKVPFYQLNDLYMYELKCEIFEYEDEVISLPSTEHGVNGEDVIEPIGVGGQLLKLQMVQDSTSNALASVSLASTIIGTKSVQYVKLFSEGNYISTPEVYISKPTRGNQATGIATAFYNSVKQVSVTYKGTNHISIPNVTFTPPNRSISSQTKFGNNSLQHSSYITVLDANFDFPTNLDTRVTAQGRTVISLWFYPTKLDPDPNFGGVLLWSDRIKLYHRTSGTVVYASGTTSVENTTPLTLNAWNFIRVEQVDNDATLSVNGVTGADYPNADPILFFAGDRLYVGADNAGAGKLDTITRGFEGYVDHLTINTTGDSAFRASSSALVPTTEGEQEIDPQTSSSAQRVNNFNNEYPVVVANLNASREVESLSIVYGGSGYISDPLMTIEKPRLGDQATAVAIMTSRGGLQNQAVDRILLINPGTGYTTPPTVTFTGGAAITGAIATCVLGERVLGPVAITTGGLGYNFTPEVGITSIFIPQSSDTSRLIENAQAEAVVSTSGTVTQIRYSNAGVGYTFNPDVTIEKVETLFFGDYETNSIVKGVSTGTSAYVQSWDSLNRILTVAIPNGNFAVGEAIVGAGVSYRISSIDTSFDNVPFADNDNIQEEADNIIDFSEKNPFGEF